MIRGLAGFFVAVTLMRVVHSMLYFKQVSIVPDLMRTHFTWFMRLRWLAIVSQALTIFVVQWLWGGLPWLLMLIVLLVLVLSNLLLWHRVVHGLPLFPWMMVLLIVLDFGLFTVLLACSGGPGNPFSVLFLVHIALVAVVLPARAAWALTLLGIVCFGSLFLLPQSPMLHASMHSGLIGSHYKGMWFAFVVAAVAIVYFVTHVATDLEKLRGIASAAHTRALRSEKLASLATLATLAAGAAHELATPLSTIAIVTKELERRKLSVGVMQDVQLIRVEIARCRTILNQMASAAGESRGETFTTVRLSALLDEMSRGLREVDRVVVSVSEEDSGVVCHVPLLALSQALRGLVKNALEASISCFVNIAVTVNVDNIIFDIEDQGCGMGEEALTHAGEPFWTTKETGKGMGLGIFLAKSVIEKLGGKLSIASVSGKGTTVTVFLPRNGLLL